MNNMHLVQQCNMMLSSIKLFRHSAKVACMKNDGRIDRQEQKYLAKIEKDLGALERTLNAIIDA